MNAPKERAGLARIFLSVGPALITASVVLGPGSILSASKVGYQQGYSMTWVLLLAVLLMIGLTALSSRLGVVLKSTLCEELAVRAGRPWAAITGVSLFLIAACFQFGNNLGVLAAVEPFLPVEQAKFWKVAIIVVINAVVLIALFGFRHLYKPVETMMKIMVGLMVLGFAVNLAFAGPDLLKALNGLIPRNVEFTRDSLLPVIGLFATTFSIGGAFYQAYLVRQKGWTLKDARQGIVDSALGIGVLGLLTMMIMLTAAAVLHGQKDIALNSATDVARQLEPLFGVMARNLFCMGIFAGAFSSFLVNAMIGGTVLSDGLGGGGNMDDRWPKICTSLALAMGMIVALGMQFTDLKPVNLIIFAQAVTTLGLPALAVALLYLATRPDLTGERAIPAWMKAVAVAALLAALVLAGNLLIKVIGALS